MTAPSDPVQARTVTDGGRGAPRRGGSLVVLVVLVIVLGANARLVIGGQTWDDVRYHTEIAPPRLAAGEAVRGGALPAWWDGTSLGVPLAAEPSHGAMYPPTWLATSPRALDWLAIAHLVWAALGVVVWARRRRPPSLVGASEPAAVVAALLVATTGILASTAMRGALPGLAHLPWIGLVATMLADATGRREAVRATILLGALVGLVGLSGSFAALVDAVLLALCLAARRRNAAYVAAAIGGGLAIACAQWVPTLVFLASSRAGAEIHGLPLARLVELVVPGSFGAPDPDRALATLAGEAAWAPSIYAGVPLLALAAVRTPARRVLAAVAALAVLALVVGRGGWPHWIGAPEVHLGALVVVLGAHAGLGIDALLAGERRALRALVVGTACGGIALGALGVLRSREPGAAAAIDPVLVHGALGVACCLLAAAIPWRAPGRATPVVLALLVLPGIGSTPSIAPGIERTLVDEPPPFAVAAAARVIARPEPARFYRPPIMFEVTRDRADVMLPRGPRPTPPGAREDLEATLATLGGAAGAKWGLGAARSEDPARLAEHDRAWHASANEGGALLDRFGIGLAMLPATLVFPRGFGELARRGDWSLVTLPVAPVASVMRGWSWAVDPEDAFALMFPMGGGSGLPRGSTVLRGGGPSEVDHGPPLPCVIERWQPGDLALACTTDRAGYAVVSSSTAPGWRVTLDGADAEWVTADVVRRAVAIPAGTHQLAWTYEAPGLRLGLLLAGIGAALLVALGAASRGRGDRARR